MNHENEHDNTSNYSKYMKYKKKYLELKNKKLQIGGVPLVPVASVASVVIDVAYLANLKQKADDFIIKNSMISDETITPCEPSQPQTESGETSTTLQPPTESGETSTTLRPQDKIIIKYNEREGVYNNRIKIVNDIIYEINNLVRLDQFSVEIDEIRNMLPILMNIQTRYASEIQNIKTNRDLCKQIIKTIDTTISTNV